MRDDEQMIDTRYYCGVFDAAMRALDCEADWFPSSIAIEIREARLSLRRAILALGRIEAEQREGEARR